jgi:GrpB-like predicted nucleotidyltransferase (UPF0157 family)
MSTFAFILMTVAAAPFFLFPAIIAIRNRKRSGRTIAALNVLMAVVLFIGIKTLLSDDPGFRIPLPGAVPLLIVWLVLLHFSIQRDTPTAEDIEERVELKNYDPAWPASFQTERRRIIEALSLPEDSIEHIGSTAVPGLSAKPVVDMMLGIKSYPPPRDLLSRLEILGYQNLGEAGVPQRIYLRLREGQALNLHVLQRDGEHWANNLALRDLLRRDPVLRARYASEKYKALQAAPGLLAYSAAKNAIVSELLAAARNL